MTLKYNSFYIMMSYNAFIYYDVKNNIWKEKILTAKNWVKKLHSIRKKLLQQWKNVVTSQVKNYNQKHKSKIFNKDDLVLLSTKNLNQKHSSKKLSHKFAESFHINKFIKKQAYHLHLSVIYQIHNVFYVSYLKSYRHKEDNIETLYFLTLKLIDEKKKYEVKKILRKQCQKSELWYKIRWKSYFTEYD